MRTAVSTAPEPGGTRASTAARTRLRVAAAAIAFDEAAKIGRVLDRFAPDLVDEVLVVDDGSTDRTGEIAEARGATVLRLPARQGVGAAIRAAIEYAIGNRFDVIVIMAGNDKDRPAEIPRLLQPIAERGYDLVQGSRYLRGGHHGNMPAYRLIATRLVHPLLFSLLVRRRITDSTNGFRAIRLAMLEDGRINLRQPWLDQYELEPYLLAQAIRLGYRVTEVPVTKVYPAHELGYTKMRPLVGWWSILRPLVLLGFGLKR